MSFFAWTNEYSVGVEAIDRQHASLFGVLNELNDAMKLGQGKTVVGPLLEELLAYTRDHFAEEERLMAATGYPNLVNHRVAHFALTKQVSEFMARFNNGEIALSIELVDFLQNWLKDHIQGTDKRYGPWMNQKGVA